MPRQRDYRAEYAARQARARAAGFADYSEQRKYRTQASKLIPGRDTKSVAARDAVAKEMKDYQRGDISHVHNVFDPIFEAYDIDYEDADWYEWLDELSPNAE